MSLAEQVAASSKARSGPPKTNDCSIIYCLERLIMKLLLVMIHKNRHVFASKRRKNIKAPPIIRGRVLFLANFQEVKNSSNGTQVRRRLHINRGEREGSGLNGVVILRNRQSLAHLSAVAQSRPRILLLLREPPTQSTILHDMP